MSGYILFIKKNEKQIVEENKIRDKKPETLFPVAKDFTHFQYIFSVLGGLNSSNLVSLLSPCLTPDYRSVLDISPIYFIEQTKKNTTIFLEKKLEHFSAEEFSKALDFIQNDFFPQFNNYHVLVVNGKYTEEELEKRFNQSLEYILSQYSFEYHLIDLNTLK